MIPINEADLWLSLSLTNGLGCSAAVQLYEACGSLEAAYAQPNAALFELIANGEGKKAAARREAVMAWKSEAKIAEMQRLKARCDGLGIEWVPYCSEYYPPYLRHIFDPPKGLFLKGNKAVLTEPMMAVVGSRDAGPYGREAADYIAETLAKGGFTVVSGMARGIDSCAHRGALRAGGSTVAVLGCGVDICYPPENGELMSAICRSGAAVSEFAPGTGAEKSHFPMRNRIISGMSQGVIVAEAGLKSGSIITAMQAIEQGREVFCVPGSLLNGKNDGAHKLIQDGARLLGSREDVEALCLRPVGLESGKGPLPEPDNPFLRSVLHQVSELGASPAQIRRRLSDDGGTAPASVSVVRALTELTVGGYIRADKDGRYYRRNRGR